MRKIYNIPLSCGFVDVLAQHFLKSCQGRLLDLAEMVVLLPNRRACQSLKEAFIRKNGLNPTLLPQMRPLADIEEDELLLSSRESAKALLELPPAISPEERQMLFIKIIMSKPAEFGLRKISLNQAAFLAKELGKLIDMSDSLQLGFSALENLAPEEYAAHWQETLKFLKIITAYWPAILKERNVCDAAWRRNRLLEIQCAAWRKNPPAEKIVIAGSSAAFPAMKNLVKTVLSLPQGEVFLHGLDKFLDEESWKAIDESHPQYELKELLDYLEFDRRDVPDFVAPQMPEKEKLATEAMRPAKTTDLWRQLRPNSIKVENLQFLDCQDIRSEALAIALKMRETLEHPGKTAALVTTDRNLSRRVASELKRWNIIIDDSAGRPLLQSPPAIFLRLILSAVKSNFAAADFLSLLKHPLCLAGYPAAEIRDLTRRFEIYNLRKKKNHPDLESFSLSVKEKMRPLFEAFSQGSVTLSSLLQEHLKAAEALAASENKSGAENLWRGEDGAALAAFFNNLAAAATVLDSVEPGEYPGLLDALLSGQTVRARYGMHPRLKILGPIEARLQHFDLTIIGEVNEGSWPQTASADPWMSRPMKKEFGFPLPERAVGVSAHDFSELLCAPDVIISRAERVMGTPMVKSRWKLRLETVLKALEIPPHELQNDAYAYYAESLDLPQKYEPISAPRPCPPLEARPRKLSVSAIELWMRDPYSIYAKYILKLKPLEDLDADLTMADFGSVMHAVLEEFNNKHPGAYPANAREELLEAGYKYFKEMHLSSEKTAFWLPKFEAGIDWVIKQEEQYRQGILKVHNEVEGAFNFEAAGGTFTLTAKADRIDETTGGKLNIIDYKTGRARSAKEVSAGFSPQLPLEGLIAREGGFPGINAADIDSLIYWPLGKKPVIIKENTQKDIDKNFENLQSLVSVFDFASTPYNSRPNPKKVPEYSDYEHLARVKEWSVSGDNDD